MSKRADTEDTKPNKIKAATSKPPGVKVRKPNAPSVDQSWDATQPVKVEPPKPRPALSLSAIASEARAEERERCLGIVDELIATTADGSTPGRAELVAMRATMAGE